MNSTRVAVVAVLVVLLAGATCLSLDAGRTLIFDQDMVYKLADAAGIAIVAV